MAGAGAGGFVGSQVGGGGFSINLLAQVLVEDYQAVIPLEVGVLSNQVPP